MLRMILVAFCLLATACTASGDIIFDNLDTQKDLSPADVEDDMFLGTLEAIHDIDPWLSLAASPRAIRPRVVIQRLGIVHASPAASPNRAHAW